LYSPGSTFKTVMSVAGLTEGAIDAHTTFYDGGSAVFFGRRFRGAKKEGFGDVDVERALKVSSDIFFYNVGARLGVDKIAEYARDFGFGSITQIDLDGEKAGIVPSTQWAATKQHRKWYPSETISVAIGQGPLVVTPLQVAVMMATIANGGTVYRPHVMRAIERVNNDGGVSRLKVATQAIRQLKLRPDVLAHVRNGLWRVVNEDGGTGSNARVSGLDISGKTGTAQVIAQSGWFSTAGFPFMQRDHAWFASYAKKDDPEMVVVIFVEHAGAHGSTAAAPLAKMLFQARFQDQLTNARLNLSDFETLEQLKEGKLPQPGVAPIEPAQNVPGLSH
jgi:penicillin-binding protein 2